MNKLKKIDCWLLHLATNKEPLCISKKWIDKINQKYPDYFFNSETLITDKNDWLNYDVISEDDKLKVIGDLSNAGATAKWSDKWLSHFVVNKICRNSIALFPVNVDKQLSFGMVLSYGCGYTVIDIDRKEDVIDENVKLYQQKWIRDFDSYTERSMSGNGYHIIIKGTIDPEKYPSQSGVGSAGIRTNTSSSPYAKGFEIYSQDRFICVTHDLIEDGNDVIEERQELLDKLCLELKKPSSDVVLKDDQDFNIENNDELFSYIQTFICMFVDGDKSELFNALFNNLCNYDYDNDERKRVYSDENKLTYPSRSESDFAFICLLVEGVQNEKIVKSIFKVSKLSERPKASRQDYLDSMILRAKTNQEIENKSKNFSEEVDLRKSIERKNLVNEAINQAYIDVSPEVAVVNSMFTESNTDPNYSVNELLADTLYSTGLVDALKRNFTEIDSEFLPFVSNKTTSIARLIDKGYINSVGFNVLQDNILIVPPLCSKLLYDITKWSYNTRIKPVLEISLASTIGILSGICGKMWQLPTNTGLNMYIILCAQSGIGKDGLHTTKDDLLYQVNEYSQSKIKTDVDIERHIVSEDFVSPQALIKKCASEGAVQEYNGRVFKQYASFCNFQTELGKRLKAISECSRDANLQGLKAQYLALYTGSGKNSTLGGMTYSKKENNVNASTAPALSIVGETTIEGYADALTPEMASDGFLSRFLTITYDGASIFPNFNGIDNTMPEKMIEDLCGLCIQESTLAGRSVTGAEKPRFVTIKMNDQAKDFCYKLEKLTLSILNGGVRTKEYYRQAWNRANLKIMKLAGLCAVCNNHTDPVINLQHLAWACRLVFLDIARVYNVILNGDSNIVQNTDMVMSDALYRAVDQYLLNKPTPKLAEMIKMPYSTLLKLHEDRVIPLEFFKIKLSSSKIFNKQRSPFMAIKNALSFEEGTLDLVSNNTLTRKYNTCKKCYIVSSDYEPNPANAI